MKSIKILFLLQLIFYFTLLFPQPTLAQCTRVFTDARCLPMSCTPGAPWQLGCICDICPCIGCDIIMNDCCPCSSPPCGGGCFTGETEISVGQESERAGEQEGKTKEIKDLQPGDIVSSFNSETGEIKEGTVSNVTRTTREGYYILETESGKKVKVTGEHPFLAIKSENNQASSTKFQTTLNNLEEIFSHTLTYRLISVLRTKLVGVLE